MNAGRRPDLGRGRLARVVAIGVCAWASLGAAQGPAVARAAEPATPQAAASSETEADAWARVKDSANAGEVRAFLAAHPAGRYARPAQTRLLVLEAKAPPPAPSLDPSVALAYMVRFDAVAQMVPKLGAPPPFKTAAPAPASTQAAELTTSQTRGAAPPSASPPPQAALEPTPPQATPPPPAPEQIATATPPPAPIAPRVQSSDPMVRPEMIAFDLPTLPQRFCSQQDMNSYLTDYHTPLDQAAKVNNQTATEHYNRLKARFSQLVAAEPGGAAFLAVDTELKAYDAEAKARYAMAAGVNDLDAKIRLIPIDPADGCAHAPWPQPVRGQAESHPATGL